MIQIFSGVKRWRRFMFCFGMAVTAFGLIPPVLADPGKENSNLDRALTLQECIKIALETNPVPQAAIKGFLAAQEGLGEARSPYYPELGLQAGYSYWQQRAFLPSGLVIPGRPTPKTIGPTDDWTAGLRARYLLFDSGERKAQYQSAMARQGLAEE